MAKDPRGKYFGYGPDPRGKYFSPNESSYDSPLKKIKGVGQKVVKKIPAEYRFLGKVAKGVGKVAKAAVKHPITTAAIAGTAYAMGASSRRYAKAPKFGEDRDLNTRLIKRGI